MAFPRFRSSPKHRSAVAQSRLVNSSRNSSVVRLGQPDGQWSDAYHHLLTLPWPVFLLRLSLTYALLNGGFAFFYWLQPAGVANAQPGSIVDLFFFSVQTMASIGYGRMYPQTTYTNLIMTIESLAGLLWLAMATGLMFARFSRPTARVLFSQVALITRHNGVPTLMFRAANQRVNQIIEAQVRVTLVRNDRTQEGNYMRRFYDLPLARSQTPVFMLTWQVMHPITPDSPLYELTPEQLADMEAEIIVTLIGLDETFAQTIQARHSYIASEVRWNVQFADILSTLPDGRRAIDYSRFHDTT